jgi:peptide chain release factor 2
LEKLSQSSNFWDDKETAAEISQRIAELKEEVDSVEKLKKDISDLKELNGIALKDENLAKELENKYFELEKSVKKEEFKTFLSGRYDRNNAIVGIYSGAGGVDAQDWATMLLRMYERYCALKGFRAKVIDQSFGEGGGPEGRIGTKSVMLEIKGPYAYGLFKKETGVHRLVRQSPFSAKKLRHTSFVLVEVLPEIPKREQNEIKINPEEIRVDVYRSSGPGGQNVNKRESAVRITHIPTGIVASSQVERLQGLNKQKAMEVLYAKLYQLKEKERKKELKNIKGKEISVSWGNQIRSYVLHPYKMIKDLRTGVEISDVERVLNGDLEEFIKAEISSKI